MIISGSYRIIVYKTNRGPDATGVGNPRASYPLYETLIMTPELKVA